MKVVMNLINTTGHTCGCESWKSHWERHTGKKALICSRDGCLNVAEVGAHVKEFPLIGPASIVPLCYECNNIKGAFKIIENRLAPAVRTFRCGK